MLRSVTILGVVAAPFAAAAPDSAANLSCPVTAPIRANASDPPVKAMVGGWWYANADRTLWAGWDAVRMEAGPKGNKVLWFRPRKAELIVHARRLDGDSAAAEIDIPCCYGGQLQASGMRFPSDGCGEVTAQTGDSDLVFVTLVYPASTMPWKGEPATERRLRFPPPAGQ